MEKEQLRSVSITLKQDSLVSPLEKKTFHCGYLFPEQIYHRLGIHRICKDITKKYKFEYDLNAILSRLIYSRILYPSSKLNTYEMSKNFLEKPKFELNHIYRPLDVLSAETDFIQSELYKNSKKVFERNDKILYYDCTNYFFEIEEADGLKQFGFAKIEECFRIMKSEFKARPIYVRRDDRIKAHFTTCFLSLVVYRYLEKELENKATVPTIITTLKNMNLLKIKGEGYLSTYERNELTDLLHEKFGFRTDYEILSNDFVKNILKTIKK